MREYCYEARFRYNLPTPGDVMRLDEDSPIIRKYAVEYIDGRLTREQALMGMVVELEAERRRLLGPFKVSVPDGKPVMSGPLSPDDPRLRPPQ